MTALTGSWRAGGFLAPAAVAAVIAGLVFTVLSDQPPPAQLQEEGSGGDLPAPAPKKVEKQEKEVTKEEEEEEESEKAPQLSEILMAEVFTNPAICETSPAR